MNKILLSSVLTVGLLGAGIATQAANPISQEKLRRRSKSV